jgi:nucleoside-diphosphate-sugar epimerase
VVIVSRTVRVERSHQIFGEASETDRMVFEPADVRQPDRLLEILQKYDISHVAHLAALQTPDCNAHRDLGLQINLAGTQNLIESIKASGLTMQRFVFASSIAVYGPRTFYPPGRVPMLAEPHPVNVYGAWKLAGENISRIFAEETGTPTISLRPGVLYGPGRDAGLTSTPTTAMKQVAKGQPYHIPFRNRQDYLYAPDVGAAFGMSLIEPFQGYATYTLPSHTVDTEQFVAAIETAASDLGIRSHCDITVGTDDVPFVCDLDYEPFLQAIPDAPHTLLRVAVKQSIEVFLHQIGGNS